MCYTFSFLLFCASSYRLGVLGKGVLNQPMIKVFVEKPLAKPMVLLCIPINRPGVAGAVLQTAL